MTRWDVVIAGASFAGLAVARELSGSALLVDRVEVGEGQTSACAAPVSVLAQLDALESVQQEHRTLVLHTVTGEIRWPLPEPFATFDYRACCRAALQGTGAEFLKAAVRGHRGTTALTSAGEREARVLVDCTGWRAALAGRRGRAGPPTRYFAVEVEAPARFPEGLHFFFWPDVVMGGYGWAFPAGGATRVGVLSYKGHSALGPALAALRDRLGIPEGPRHGGPLGVGLGPAVVDGVFLVGDAAGHCLPLSGEGIRTAVWAGQVCGRLIQSVLQGRLTVGQAQRAYRRYVAGQRIRVALLRGATWAVLTLPPRLLGPLALWPERGRVLGLFWRLYLGSFSPRGGGDGPGEGPQRDRGTEGRRSGTTEAG